MTKFEAAYALEFSRIVDDVKVLGYDLVLERLLCLFLSLNELYSHNHIVPGLSL